jgi:hypothetical protein
MNRLEKRQQFTKEFIKKGTQLHNDKYDYSKVEYVNSRTKVKIICPEHGEFEQLPSSHLQGNGCPKCAREWTDAHKKNHCISSQKSRGMTTEQWIERAKQVHGDKYDYSLTVYVNQRTNVKIICPIHGVFEQKADSHIRGNSCRLCGLASDNHKGVHDWSPEQRDKVKQTCLKRYGAERYLDSNEGRAKNVKIRSTPEFKKKMRNIISSDEIQDKIKATNLARYGVSFPSKLKVVQDKIYKTKKKNHTVSSSKAEVIAYDVLCNKFGKHNVIHQHKLDDRYPFICDFYIKSLDVFIELNLHWSHGYHWFDETNTDDKLVLNAWIEKAKISSYYQSAINIWTKRDVLKRETAKENHLNYIVFWKQDLSDFYQWIENGCPIINSY